ncbi:hypothetical protein SAMN05216205_6116, partial [Pseudomonas mohnii]
MVAHDNTVSEANVGQGSNASQLNHSDIVFSTSGSYMTNSVSFDYSTNNLGGSVLDEEHFFDASVGASEETISFNFNVVVEGETFANIDRVTFVELLDGEIIRGFDAVSKMEHVRDLVISSSNYVGAQVFN